MANVDDGMVQVERPRWRPRHGYIMSSGSPEAYFEDGIRHIHAQWPLLAETLADHRAKNSEKSGRTFHAYLHEMRDYLRGVLKEMDAALGD